MNDNEIIKRLEEELKTALIINHRFEESNDTENPDDHTWIALLSNTIKFINRQKAEIERLKTDNKKHYFVVPRGCGKTGTIRSKIICIEDRAIKCFADRLCEDRLPNDPVVIAVKCELKEMVGDGE